MHPLQGISAQCVSDASLRYLAESDVTLEQRKAKPSITSTQINWKKKTFDNKLPYVCKILVQSQSKVLKTSEINVKSSSDASFNLNRHIQYLRRRSIGNPPCCGCRICDSIEYKLSNTSSNNRWGNDITFSCSRISGFQSRIIRKSIKRYITVGPADICLFPNEEKSVHAEPAITIAKITASTILKSTGFPVNRREHFAACFSHLHKSVFEFWVCWISSTVSKPIHSFGQIYCTWFRTKMPARLN